MPTCYLLPIAPDVHGMMLTCDDLHNAFNFPELIDFTAEELVKFREGLMPIITLNCV